jgi:integrase
MRRQLSALQTGSLGGDGIDTRAIQDWLGHVSITHTTRYTALSAVQGLLARLRLWPNRKKANHDLP